MVDLRPEPREGTGIVLEGTCNRGYGFGASWQGPPCVGLKGACGFSYLAEGAHSVCFEQRLATIAFKGCKNLVGVNRL